MLINNLKLPDVCDGCQIRGGDKITETSLLSPQQYIEKFKEISSRDVFVLTDDYSLFEKLKQLAPQINWFTLCDPKERRYVHSAFTSIDAEQKHAQMVRFISSMQILMKASRFVGSITTGPSLFLLKMNYPNSMPIDCNAADFPDICNLRVALRGQISKKFLGSPHK